MYRIKRRFGRYLVFHHKTLITKCNDRDAAKAFISILKETKRRKRVQPK